MKFYEAMRRAYTAGYKAANTHDEAFRFEVWFKEHFGHVDGQQHLRIESIELQIVRTPEAYEKALLEVQARQARFSDEYEGDGELDIINPHPSTYEHADDDDMLKDFLAKFDDEFKNGR